MSKDDIWRNFRKNCENAGIEKWSISTTLKLDSGTFTLQYTRTTAGQQKCRILQAS
jgi:hypothetical protein